MIGVDNIVQNAFLARVAIPAFNVPYLPMIEPVVTAVVDQNSFALIETARLEWLKSEAQGPEAVAREFSRWQVPDHVRLHLDHVPVVDEDGQQVDYLEIIRCAIACGYHSVMIDGSRLALPENIEATRRAVDLAHQSGIPCEAELGAVLGHEDRQLPPYEQLFQSGLGFTRETDAHRFVVDTGCDWLSVAIGNIHGSVSAARKNEKKVSARLDLDHLRKLARATKIPLVLHGGSGIPSEYVRAAFQNGIAKINVATEIRQAYEAAWHRAGSIAVAQEVVYERTCWLLADYFGLAGIQPHVLGEMS